MLPYTVCTHARFVRLRAGGTLQRRGTLHQKVGIYRCQIISHANYNHNKQQQQQQHMSHFYNFDAKTRVKDVYSPARHEPL